MQIIARYAALLAYAGIVCGTPLVTKNGAVQTVIPTRMDIVEEASKFAKLATGPTKKGSVSGAFPNRTGTFLSFEKLEQARIYDLVLSNTITFTGAIDIYRVPESFDSVPVRVDGTIAWTKLGTIYTLEKDTGSLVSDIAQGKSSVSLLLLPSLQYKSTQVLWTESASPIKGFALRSIMATPMKRYVSRDRGNFVVPRDLVVITGSDHFRISEKPAVKRGIVSGPSPWAVGVLASFVIDVAGSYNLVLIKPSTAIGKISIYSVPEDFSGDVVPLVDGLPSWTSIGTIAPQKNGRSNIIRHAVEAVNDAKFLLLPEYRAADTNHMVEVEWADNFATKTGLVLENAVQVD